MNKIKRIILIMVTTLMVLLTGNLTKAQENPYALQTQVIQNQQQIKLLQQQQAQLYLKLDSLLVKYGEIKGELDSLSHRLDIIQQQLNQLLMQQNRSLPPTQQPKAQPQPTITPQPQTSQTQNPTPSPQETNGPASIQTPKNKQQQQALITKPKPSKPVIPQDEKVFNEALNLFKEKKYNQAIEALKSFQRKFKNSKYLPDAIFFLAQSYYAKGEFDKAIINYDYLVNTYPNNPHVAEATLKEGISFIKMGDRVDGNYLLQKVIKSFPNSKEATIARKLLKGNG